MSKRQAAPAWAVMFALAAAGLPASGFAQTPDLPLKAPAPELREPAQDAPEGAPQEAGEDQDLPATGEGSLVPSQRPTEGAIIPPEAAAPEPRPEPTPEATPKPAPGAAAPTPEPVPVPRGAPEPEPKSEGTIVPPGEMACRARLAELGVAFEVRRAEGDPSGCSLPFPVAVTRLSGSVAIEPEILVNCRTAEAAARFVRDHVGPAVKLAFKAELKSIRQDSGYVCRPRNGTTRLSEHAFGNAIDFGAFRLSDGHEIMVEKTRDATIGRFFARLRKAACGPFKTVLGPGSDADHATHFHFDLATRRGGSAYCR